ncbi:MAG: putative tricarboxylic transport membrane protein [Desulforhopalus sp.]|jgi:putative tricarboxylic transport membrane protein
METIHFFLQGLTTATMPINLLMLVVGIIFGMLVGAIPGISAANGIALMLPVTYTFGLAPETALILYAAIYYGAKYSGRISAILNDIPGDVSSFSTKKEGYPLALAGFAGKALALTAASSFVGGTAAILVLTFTTKFFADIGSSFGPPEYVALIAFVFVLILTLSSTHFVKNLISLCLGLMMSVVGLDWGTGAFRYTSNIPELFDGIDFIIVVIGVFALSESFLLMEKPKKAEHIKVIGAKVDSFLPQLWRVKWACLRASTVGLLIGILPGAGTYVANIAAYRFEEKLGVKTDETPLGKGNFRGLIAPEAANSACALGAFLPLMALGIPGSATTAVLHGALLQMNIDPGPSLCRSSPEIIWAMIASMYLGNILLLLINVKLIRYFPKLLAIPGWVLMPMIVVVSFVSVYAVSQSFISLLIMVLIGFFSYGLRKFDYPLAPLILGYVLGKPFEDNFRLALTISGGDIAKILESPASQLLWSSVLLAILVKGVVRWRSRFSQ